MGKNNDNDNDNDIFEAANGELTRLSAAFSSANEALGKLTYIVGNMCRMYRGCTAEGPHKPEVQSASIGVQDGPGAKARESWKGRDLKDIVDEILSRSSYDVPRKCVRYRMLEDGIVEFLIQTSSTGFRSSERFRVGLYDGLDRTVAMFDDAVESLHGPRFGRKMKMGFDLADLLKGYFGDEGDLDDGGWNSL